MAPQDAVDGWNEHYNAEAYARFTQQYPMYSATSRDLVHRAGLGDARLVVDLCGGTGSTTEAILTAAPRARVISLDAAAAMQAVGRRVLTDARVIWITAAAEDIARHLDEPADAVVCNSAIWKTDTVATFTAVRTILRPGGRFAFNVGGGFADVTHPDEQAARTGPTLNQLINDIAARDHGHTPTAGSTGRAALTPGLVREQLHAAGFTAVDTAVTAHRGTMAEKHAWLSIPLFARPEGLTHAQRMDVLAKAYRQVDPAQTVVTSWLVVTAQTPDEEHRATH